MLIRHTIPFGESTPLIQGVLHFTHVKNSGAAFGVLQNQRVVFLVASIVVIIAILYYYWQDRSENKLINGSLGLVLGGAIGNLVDRVFLGKVTDFIDFRVWPVFNLADSAIVIGAILLGIILTRDAFKKSEVRGQESEEVGLERSP